MKTAVRKIENSVEELVRFGKAKSFAVVYACGAFRMYYPVKSASGNYIAEAVSADGIDFRFTGRAVNGVNADSCAAVRKNGRILLFYSERGALRLAVGNRNAEFTAFPVAIVRRGVPKGIKITVTDGKRYIFADGKNGKLPCYVFESGLECVPSTLTVSGISGKILEPNFYGVGQKTRLVYSDGKTVREVEGVSDLREMTFVVEKEIGVLHADAVRTVFLSGGEFIRFERYGGSISSVSACASDGTVRYMPMIPTDVSSSVGSVLNAVCNRVAVLPDVMGDSVVRVNLHLPESGKSGVRVKPISGGEGYINYDITNKVITVKGVSGTGEVSFASYPLTDGDAECYIEVGTTTRFICAGGLFTFAFEANANGGAKIVVYTDKECRFDAELYKLKEQK